MATLAGYEIHVTDEQVPFEVEKSTHPVERGKDITDHIKETPQRISLTGKVVNPGASEKRDAFRELAKSGTPVIYDGRNAAYSMQILSFNTTHTSRIANGYEFTAELEELRVVDVAQKVPESTDPTGTATAAQGNLGVQQLQQTGDTVEATIKAGDTFWGLAGTFKTTIAAIQALNPGVDPKKLQIGQKVRVK